MQELACLSMGRLRTKPGSTPSVASQYSLRNLHVNIMLNPRGAKQDRINILAKKISARPGMARDSPYQLRMV
jgi:hypothetical protein